MENDQIGQKEKRSSSKRDSRNNKLQTRKSGVISKINYTRKAKKVEREKTDITESISKLQHNTRKGKYCYQNPANPKKNPKLKQSNKANPNRPSGFRNRKRTSNEIYFSSHLTGQNDWDKLESHFQNGTNYRAIRPQDKGPGNQLNQTIGDTRDHVERPNEQDLIEIRTSAFNKTNKNTLSVGKGDNLISFRAKPNRRASQTANSVVSRQLTPNPVIALRPRNDLEEYLTLSSLMRQDKMSESSNYLNTQHSKQIQKSKRQRSNPRKVKKMMIRLNSCELNLSSAKMRSQGSIKRFQFGNVVEQVLDLRKNNFSDFELGFAFDLKFSTNEFRSLRLSSCNLGDSGLSVVLEKINEWAMPIRKLDVSDNDLTGNSLDLVHQFLKNDGFLDELNISDNFSVTPRDQVFIDFIQITYECLVIY